MSEKYTQKLKSLSINRQFWGYVLPTVGAMLVSGLYQLVDGIFIGRFIGAEGLAGIHMASPAVNALYGTGMMLGVGSGAISSIARGEKNSAKARQALGNGFSLILFLGLLCSLLLTVGGHWILTLQNASGVAAEHATRYLQIIAIAAPMTAGSMAIPLLVRNDQAPFVATLLIVLGAVMNIMLNALFIGYFGWGLAGAALGTVLSQSLLVVLGLIYFFSEKAHTRLSLKALRPDWKMNIKICSTGFSSMLMFFYFSFITMAHNYLFLQHGDHVLVGAFAIVGYVGILYYLFAEGVAAGTQPLISYHYGSGNLDLMKSFIRRMLWVTIGFGVLMVAVINVFADSIAHIFSGDDMALHSAAVLGLRLHLMAIFLDGLIFCAGVFFQSIGVGRKATFITMGNMLIQLPFLLILPQVLGTNGVWLSVPMSNIALSLLIVWMLVREWRKFSHRQKEHVRNASSQQCTA